MPDPRHASSLLRTYTQPRFRAALKPRVNRLPEVPVPVCSGPEVHGRMPPQSCLQPAVLLPAPGRHGVQSGTPGLAQVGAGLCGGAGERGPEHAGSQPEPPAPSSGRFGAASLSGRAQSTAPACPGHRCCGQAAFCAADTCSRGTWQVNSLRGLYVSVLFPSDRPPARPVLPSAAGGVAAQAWT